MVWPLRNKLARDGLRRAAAAAATALALAVLAPWSSFTLPFAARLGEFLACALVWEACLALACLAARHWRGADGSAGPAMLAGCCLVASAPATTAMSGVVSLAGDGTGPLPFFYAKSLLLSLVISFARRGLRPGAVTGGPPGVDPAAARPPSCPAAAFLHRHAPALARARLVALQAEDHYLRIHTDAGSALVLLRLRDAVAQLEGAGWQPHRSFWLARGAGGRAVRRGQAWQVVLDSGLQVPVSKPAVAAMWQAGYAAAT